MGRPGFRGRRALRGRGAFRRGRLLLGRKSGGGGGGRVSGPRRGNRRCVVTVLYNDDTSEKKKTPYHIGTDYFYGKCENVRKISYNILMTRLDLIGSDEI
jgi:hypothetical protein